MAMITNIQHFLDENGEVPEDLPFEAQELVTFLSAVIEAATAACGEPLTFSSK